MDEQTDGRTDGRTDERMDGRFKGGEEGKIDRHVLSGTRRGALCAARTDNTVTEANPACSFATRAGNPCN